MGYLPLLDNTTGLLPPGRYAADLQMLKSIFVSGPGFAGSTTRAELWNEWENHRSTVEAMTGNIARIWIAGSFISSTLNPQDIDVTYLIPPDAYDQMDSETVDFLDQLTDRAWCVSHDMRIDSYALRLPDEMEFWTITPSLLTPESSQAFRDIGLYDEIWQRTRANSHGPGYAGKLRRGYVEVQL
ncbi:hypothetical protein GCM10010329_27600 [Streptomyces spiroverticillatus]|uniref:Uncharacterized protein n=1 Tax=Streptomyces finlayi TaxID=67296 RepID=A0A919C913_9ACTN|nr:hypothetical protein [Streptomyces finlayi]GHA03681.1 hypothetical protein GCM10010329_27600 [Streptomyces spiroverticillatus]GHC87813.1 hypothetical protein GCM10010334_20010 [Streptomyces finlayi]